MCPSSCNTGLCEFVISGSVLKCPMHLAKQTDQYRSSAILGPDQAPSLREEVFGQGDRYSPVQSHYSLHCTVVTPSSFNMEGLLLGADTHPLTYHTYETDDLEKNYQSWA